MEYKIFKELPDDAKLIRETVFVKEQGFKEEFDSVDLTATHIVIYNNGKPAAVGRYFNEGNSPTYHIGRVAVMKEYRGLGYGKDIMDIAEKHIKAESGEKIEVSAQLQAKPFYEKCGYTAVGDIYYDEHCKHILMFKNI